MLPVVLSLSLFAPMQHEGHTLPISDEALVISINPEARVSVTRGATLPPQRCGRPIAIPVLVHDLSRGQTRLSVVVPGGEATVDDVAIHDVDERSHAIVTLRLAVPATTLVTVRVDVGPGTLDLKGRSEASILIRCL